VQRCCFLEAADVEVVVGVSEGLGLRGEKVKAGCEVRQAS